MPANTYDYAISGGIEGKSRLNILASILHPYTQTLLEQMGVQPGAAFLDSGCGGGNVAIMAAKMVGNEGKVTAIDFDPDIIRLAEIDRAQENLGNLSFHVKSSYDIDYSNVFDFSYARFLLSHLKDPLAALLRMKEAVKPGGKIIVEDVHFSGHFCYPHHDSFAHYLELYTAVVSQRGGNAELGPELPGLFRQAGIGEVGFDVIQPCFDHGEGKWMGYITMARIRDAVIQAKLADTQELDRLLQQFEEFTSRPDTILSLPRIFRVWGIKE